jgi:hypothetical protein
VNDRDTTLLSARLHRLADDVTPPLDVVAQVREARDRNRRRRHGRLALAAVATATAALAVGTTAAIELLSSAPDRGQVAVPNETAPETSESAPTTPAVTSPATETEDPAQVPASWEQRSFLGVTFAVPPGARMEDYVQTEPLSEGPTFIWNGPHLGGDAYAHVKVTVGSADDPGGMPGYEQVSVLGAQRAYAAIGTGGTSDPFGGPIVETTDLGLEIFTDDRRVHVDASFVAGPEGEQMARDLITSIEVH